MEGQKQDKMKPNMEDPKKMGGQKGQMGQMGKMEGQKYDSMGNPIECEDCNDPKMMG